MPPAKNEALSTREIQCLRLFAQGCNDCETGAELKISARTVRFHSDNMKRKLKAKNKTHAIAIAYEQKILHLPAPLPMPA